MLDGQQWRRQVSQNFQGRTNAAAKKGSMEAQHFGDCWIEAVVRRTCFEVTKDLKRELKRRKKELVLNGEELDTDDQSEEMQELLRHRDDGTVEVRKRVIGVQGNSFHGMAKVRKEGDWKMKICQRGRGNRLQEMGRKYLRTSRRETRVQEASPGEAQSS